MFAEVQDYDIDVARTLMMVEATVRKHTRLLGEMGFVNGIDEVAIQVPNRLALLNLLQAATAVEDVALTNTATDHVETLPLRTCYAVDYAFLTGFLIDGVHKYRIEVMHKKHGLSPLHDVLVGTLGDVGAAWLVHASFKCSDENDYMNALHRLKENSYESVQRCESSYGRFSYWQPLEINEEEDRGEFVFLKPRVNLRDTLSAHA